MGIGDLLGVFGPRDDEEDKKLDLTEIKSLVSQFAEAWWAEKDARQKKDKLKKKIVALHKANGVDFLEGNEGVLKVVRKADSVGFIAKAAKELLTEEQIKMCTGVTRKGSITVEFTPTAKRPGE